MALLIAVPSPAEERPADPGDSEKILLLEKRVSDLERELKNLKDQMEHLRQSTNKMSGAFGMPTSDVKAIVAKLMEHARAGEVDAMREILAKGHNPNLKDDNGMSALMHAATAGHEGAVNLLLEYKANPRQRNRDGKTALDLAKNSQKESIVALLQE